MKKYSAAMIKGVCSGVICSLIINMWIILSFCTSFNNLVLYLIGLPLGILVFILMRQTKIKNFAIACVFCILMFVVTEITISGLGIVNMFYNEIMGDEIKMTAGDGFGVMVIHIFNYSWIIVGKLTAFIFTAIKQIKTNKNK